MTHLVRSLVAIFAITGALVGCGEGGESNSDDPVLSDPVAMLKTVEQSVDGLIQCDTEMAVDLGGYNKAGCIVPDDELAVGVDSNLLLVTEYEGGDALQKYKETYDDGTTPIYYGNGWFVSAPKQELLDQAVTAIEEMPSED